MVGPKRRKRFPWAIVWVAVLAVGGGGAWFWRQRAAAADAARLPTGVQVGKAQRGDIEQRITATGEVAAQVGAKVNIGSQISGQIKKLTVDVGNVVKVGQLIAEVDAPDLKAQVDQQRQAEASARFALTQAESRLTQAVLNVRLSKDQTQAQIDAADFGVKVADEHLQSASAAAKMQPQQTTTDIAKADAALSTAKSQERQVKATVDLQLLQAQTSVDDAKAAADNSLRLRRREEGLLARGFISQQEVDDTRTSYRQYSVRLDSAAANLRIVKEKNAADLQAARDTVKQAEATLEAAKSERFTDAMRDADERNARQAKLQSQATLALQQSSRTQDAIRERAVEEAQGAVKQAAANLKQAQALLNYQVALLDKAIIRSPISGTVLSVVTQEGETVAAGFSVATLVTVADLKRLEVRGYVDEVDIGRVHVGLPAEVRVESHPNRVFHGRVTKIASASTVKDNVITYETTIAIRDADGLLLPDMTADVTLVLGRTPNVLLIPTEAVHREVSRSAVYVLHRNLQGKGRVEKRTIKTGVQDGNHSQVLSGLKEGEEVVLAGLQRLGVNASDAQNAPGKKEQ